MRVAAVDVGTNSVHLLVAEVTPEGNIRVVEKARDQVELGSGGLATHRITDEAFSRGVRALEAFKQACDSLDVEDVHAAATSAVREAENGLEFCKAVKEATGIHIRVISGRDEARIIYLGVRSDLDFSAGRVLVFDLGGGSTEFILCDPETPLVTASLPLGHIRLADRYHRTDPMSEEDHRALKADVREHLAPLRERVHPDDFGSIVGTSGTVRTLGLMATLARGETPPEHAHGLVLRRQDLDHFVRTFRTLPEREIAKLPGMDPRRLRTLPAGAVLVREILKMFGKDQVVTSERSLRDGLIADWVLRHRPEVTLSATVPDPRRRSVLTVMKRYGVDREHAEHVSGFALQIYDATVGIHGLRVDDRRMLEFAALLHDVGHHISGKDHHKHGQYLIRHTRMPGFTAPEIGVLANLVRYHRGSRPKTTHPEFAALPRLDRRRVRVLGAVLRVADALDRGHNQNVEHLEVRVEDARLLLRAHARDAGELEQWAVVHRRKLLESVLDREVAIEVVPTEAGVVR